MSTITDIPLEVLQEIFYSSLSPLDINDSLHTFRSLDLIPVTLSHVCRRWFQASISCTVLWSRLGIILEGDNQPSSVSHWCKRRILSGPSRVQFTVLFLQRSGQSLLDVTILPSTNRPSVLSTYDQQCLDHVFASCNVVARIRSLHISSQYAPLLRDIQGPLLSLEQVTLTGYLSEKHKGLAPRLSQASRLWDVTIDDHPKGFILPWSQVRRITLRGTAATLDAVHFLFLQHIPVEELTIQGEILGDFGDNSFGRYGERTTFPTLRRLYLEPRLYMEEIGKFFDLLRLPSLTDVEIEVGRRVIKESMPYWPMALQKLVDVSQCFLSSLVVEGLPYSIVEGSILRKLPSCHDGLTVEHPTT